MVKVIATFNIKPNSIQEALKIAQKLIFATRLEFGCIEYILVQSESDETHLVMLESWESQQHLDVHSASEHFTKYVPQLAALCSAPPVVEKFKVAI
ncbi:putative quinol monooxygenase [Lacrimispora sp.]|uniref:putative quinol monooxygenase n=1 Tax=Lacrimispora sp. TaxID=2719234 RepID=UPI0028AD4C9C|nr:putative quinol monooxygenase [Lacrimispora sp.]